MKWLLLDATYVQKVEDGIKLWLIWLAPLTSLLTQPAKKAVVDEIWFLAKMAPVHHEWISKCSFMSHDDSIFGYLIHE